MPAWNTSPQRVSQMVPETQHMLSRARPGFKQKTTCHTNSTSKGSRGVSKPYPWGRGQRPRVPETMSASVAPNWCHHWCPIPSKPLPSKLGIEEGDMKSSVTFDLGIPMPLSPNFLQLAMDQCRLRLNEQGELLLVNTESPCSSHLGPGDGLGAPLHLSSLTLRRNKGNWKSSPIGCHHFQPLPLPGNGFLFPQCPYNLGKAEHLVTSYEE